MRGLQEALTNTRRHSSAQKVIVRLRVKEEELVTEVIDDGQGCGVEMIPVVGLESMCERAAGIGAKPQIDSQAGNQSAATGNCTAEGISALENPSTPTRVMLVEDQIDVRYLMAALLGRQADLEVVAQAGSLAGARSHAATVKFDVAILDLGLPDGNGADLIAELRRARPGTEILILTASRDPKNLEKAAEASADEILDKFAAPGEVIGAIRRIRSGESPMPFDTTERT